MQLSLREDVGQLVTESVLLTDERKKVVRERISTMNEKQLSGLRGALLQEYTLLADALSKVIDQKVGVEKDAKFAEQLKVFFHGTNRRLRETRESQEKTEEDLLLTKLDSEISQSSSS